MTPVCPGLNNFLLDAQVRFCLNCLWGSFPLKLTATIGERRMPAGWKLNRDLASFRSGEQFERWLDLGLGFPGDPVNLLIAVGRIVVEGDQAAHTGQRAELQCMLHAAVAKPDPVAVLFRGILRIVDQQVCAFGNAVAGKSGCRRWKLAHTQSRLVIRQVGDRLVAFPNAVTNCGVGMDDQLGVDF